jgi:hypothetical protein
VTAKTLSIPDELKPQMTRKPSVGFCSGHYFNFQEREFGEETPGLKRIQASHDFPNRAIGAVRIESKQH